MNEKRRAFLKAYLAMCVAYQMTIRSCGCCNSLFITFDDEEDDIRIESIRVDLEKQTLKCYYEHNDASTSIVISLKEDEILGK